MKDAASATANFIDANHRASGESVSRILAAAESLFAEHGFEAASINEIADRASVSKANIFHHFSSKRELYLSVLHNACKDATTRLQNLEAPTGAFSQRFDAYASDMLHSMLQQEPLHRIMQRELLSDATGGVAKELAERVFGDKFARLVAILRGGQTSGELRADMDPAMVAIILIAANRFFLTSRNVFKHFPDVNFATDPERYTTLLVDILLHGILRPPMTAVSEER